MSALSLADLIGSCRRLTDKQRVQVFERFSSDAAMELGKSNCQIILGDALRLADHIHNAENETQQQQEHVT